MCWLLIENTYCKSSIKLLLLSLFFSSTFEGVGGGGGGVAYLILLNASTGARFLEDGPVVPGRYTAFLTIRKNNN